MKRFISVLLVIALLVPMLCVDVFAENKTVSDFTGLKDAIAIAADGDVITVASNITLDETLAIEHKNITIKGTSGLAILGKNALTNNEVKNTMFVIRNSKVKFDGLTLGGNKMNRIIYSEKSDIELNKASINDGCPGNNSNINPGGGIFLRGGSLKATDTTFSGNTPGTAEGLPKGDGDKNGGAIYVGSDSTDITIEGGSFVGNTVPAFGHGAAIYQNAGKLNINKDTTKENETTFTENTGYKSLGDAGTQGVCIHTREGVTADINKVTATVVPGFNTGGFLRSLGGTLSIKNSKFTIAPSKGEIGIAGGVISSQNSKMTIEKSNFKAGDGTRVAEAGGLIEIVGTGKFNLTGSTLEGAGAWWNAGKYTANTGGAISFYDGSTVTANITDTTIKNIMADGNGAGIALSKGNGHKSSVNLTLKNTTIQNAAVYTWQANSYGGCMYIGEGNTVKIDGGKISGQTTSNVAAGIYNMGDLEITGKAQITGNTAYQMVGGIYHGGTRLKIDEATLSGNQKGDNSTGHNHFIEGKEKSGINIYADKDVIITPKATFDDNDVRVFDGQSSILLTGKLTKKINVSISEEKKTTDSKNANIKVFEEDKHRKVGYVVAKGTESYEPTADDAKNLHYVTNDTTQAVAGADDHTSPGKWDYVLNPEDNTIVLGQRVKLIYHGNTGKIGTEEKKEKTVDVYKAGDFWEKQLDKYKVADPEKDKHEFMAWYFWKDGANAGETDASVQDIKNPETVKDNLFDFSKVDFSSKGKNEIVDILTPNVINTYAGWSKNISIPVLKEWIDADEADKVDVTVTLKGREKEETLTLTKAGNYFNQFEDLKVFTKSYEGEKKNMNLKFTPIEYKVEETSIDGFTTSYSPQSMKANEVAEVSRFVVTNKKIFKVTYEFKPEDSSKTLPAGVTSQLPKEETGKANGDTVKPSKSSFKDFTDGDGTWSFKSWDANSKTINKADVKFIGTWTFTETPQTKYKATYEFKSGTEGKTLPAAIEGYKPTDDTEYADKATVTAKAPIQTSYEDTENNGTWTFTTWDANSKTINKADVKFVGTWTFAAKPQTKYKATYEFKSGTEGKDLPAAIEGYKPTDTTEYADGATVNAKQPTQTTYEDTENNGTWTFTTWDANSKTINKADVKFIGTWTFTKKPEPKSNFSITKTVDKQTYEKAGEVLNYTITVTNTGEADLKDLKLIDALVGVNEKTFNLNKGKSETFTYTYTITEADVRAREVINTATVTHGKDSKKATATSILKEKEKRGDVYVRYETEDGKILDEFAVLIDAPVGTYYYTEEKAFPRYRFVGLAPYSNPAEGYVVEGTQYVVYLYRRDRGGRTPDRRDRYEREEKEVEEPIVEAKRKPELNKKDHKQYMYGYPDWTFVPAANITRGEAAAMFARLFKEYPGLDYNYKKYYTDVDESYWGFKEVAYLSEFGILSGYSDGTFRPNNKITRAEFVKIAESFEALTWGLSPYNDVDGGHWAFRYIVSSAAKGWISGYPDGSFRPNSFISRAEAVTIVNRLLERRPDKDYIDTHKPELKPFTDLKPSYWAYYEIYEAVDGHDYNRSFTDIEEHWYRLNNERFVFSQPRYYR